MNKQQYFQYTTKSCKKDNKLILCKQKNRRQKYDETTDPQMNGNSIYMTKMKLKTCEGKQSIK